MYYYALTITDVRGDRSYHRYEDYIDQCNLAIAAKGYEYTPTLGLPNNGLHVHLLVCSSKRMTRKQVTLYPRGWSIRLNHLKTHLDIGVWTFYITKDILENIESEQLVSHIGKPESALLHAPEGAESPTSMCVNISSDDDDPEYIKFLERIKNVRLV